MEKAQQKRKEQDEQQILRKKHAALNFIKEEEPEEYEELKQLAADNLGLDVNKPGVGGRMKIKFEIFRILEL